MGVSRVLNEEQAHLQHFSFNQECEETSRVVLREGSRQRLLAYEKKMRKENCQKPVIFNLLQSPQYMQSLSDRIPCLLTRTSLLWSTAKCRALIPVEHLVVMGVPMFARGRAEGDRFAVETLFWQGKLASKDLCMLSGNSMAAVAIGSILLFALGATDVPAIEKKNCAHGAPTPRVSPPDVRVKTAFFEI